MVGGAARNLLATIDHELKRGYRIHVAVGQGSDAAGFPEGVEVSRIPYLSRSPDPRNDLRALHDLSALVSTGFDVVNTHQSKAGVLGRLAARNKADAAPLELCGTLLAVFYKYGAPNGPFAGKGPLRSPVQD